MKDKIKVIQDSLERSRSIIDGCCEMPVDSSFIDTALTALASLVEEERSACAERACEWLYPKDGIYDCSMRSAFMREEQKKGLRYAIKEAPNV